MLPIEALTVQLANQHPPFLAEGLEAFTEVPAKRPRRFLTVERTGGPRGQVTDRALLAVQVWAESRYEAGRLAELVARELKPALSAHPRVARVGVTSIHHFPDLQGRTPRYQVVAEVVAT